MDIHLKMDEVRLLRLVIALKIPITTTMAPNEVAIRMKGQAMWPIILKICPIIGFTNTATYETILTVDFVANIRGKVLMSTALDAHII